MARLTKFNARKPLAVNTEINLGAEGFNSGQWGRMSLSIVVRDEYGEYAGMYTVHFDRKEAERVATGFREYLDAKIDTFGRPL